ncbi:MAG: zinc ribbon domain-containing protein [Candidatus Nitrosopelagicus sp.]|nr:zinc ribbon domain-containing protein [Candidatus Nitrosopelagicus sp.]
MSDSTIDDALRLLEIGKGNPDRLKQVIESFQKRSMISMQDRKYVEALVEQYLTPRHRQMTSRMKETKVPRIRKWTDSSFKITEVKTASGNPNIKTSTSREVTPPSTSKDSSEKPLELCRKCGAKILDNNKFCIECGTKIVEMQAPKKEELASRETTIEEKFIEHIETDRSNTKKSSNGKRLGIIIGVIAVIIIVGGATYIGSSSDLFSANTEIEERITCENNTILVSSTKVPGFPTPGNDLKYYQDRYQNEPKYKEWFDKNFPGQTVKQVLAPYTGDEETKVPGFPDPEKDLQYYLDRYDNEPKYKEWFDKNFPGQTLREAVC